MEQPEPIEKLLQDLQIANSYRRMTAAEELGRRVPAEQRTLDALTNAAKADENTAVRRAAAKSYLDLTSAGSPQPSSETAATMTEAPTTSPVLPVWLSEGKEVVAAILSFVWNIAAIIISVGIAVGLVGLVLRFLWLFIQVSWWLLHGAHLTQ